MLTCLFSQGTGLGKTNLSSYGVVRTFHGPVLSLGTTQTVVSQLGLEFEWMGDGSTSSHLVYFVSLENSKYIINRFSLFVFGIYWEGFGA